MNRGKEKAKGCLFIPPPTSWNADGNTADRQLTGRCHLLPSTLWHLGYGVLLPSSFQKLHVWLALFLMSSLASPHSHISSGGGLEPIKIYKP